MVLSRGVALCFGRVVLYRRETISSGPIRARIEFRGVAVPLGWAGDKHFCCIRRDYQLVALCALVTLHRTIDLFPTQVTCFVLPSGNEIIKWRLVSMPG
jgi:hypothetical protein